MISIITGVLNGEETIRQTIESVCNQTMLPTEYIIVDNGSTDSTRDIVKEYMQKYPFIKLVSEENRGIYPPMNKGIELAKGNLIGIINSNDWYEPIAVETMWKSYNTNGSGVHYGRLRYIKKDKTEFILENPREKFFLKMPHPATFVTSDIYKKYGVFDVKYRTAADLELFIRYAKQKVPFYSLNEVVANFRLGGRSSTHKAGLEALFIRRQNGVINTQDFLYRFLKLKVKQLLNY